MLYDFDIINDFIKFGKYESVNSISCTIMQWMNFDVEICDDIITKFPKVKQEIDYLSMNNDSEIAYFLFVLLQFDYFCNDFGKIIFFPKSIYNFLKLILDRVKLIDNKSIMIKTTISSADYELNSISKLI